MSEDRTPNYCDGCKLDSPEATICSVKSILGEKDNDCPCQVCIVKIICTNICTKLSNYCYKVWKHSKG